MGENPYVRTYEALALRERAWEAGGRWVVCRGGKAQGTCPTEPFEIFVEIALI